MRYGLLGIFVSCYLSFVLHVFGLIEQKPPLNELGITLDYTLFATFPRDRTENTARNYEYSSHLTFNGPVSKITSAQLWGLAYVAYGFIKEDRNQYNIGKKGQPTALTILAWGNEIILASSQKGSTSFTYEEGTSAVSMVLELCQTSHVDSRQHRRQGKCGEPMAAHMYYLSRPDTYDLSNENAVIGTVLEIDGKLQKQAPCGEGDDWGCNEFVKKLNLKVLSNDIGEDIEVLNEPGLAGLAGGLVSKNQIQLCGSIREL